METNQTDLLESLAESLSEKVEQKRKASQPLPEIYSSGMRGNEKPPSRREQKKDEKGKDGKGKDGKRKVEFNAAEKKSSKQIIAELNERIAKLEKGQQKPKKKIKIA